MPPAKLWTFLNPDCRKKFTAFALRTPERQCATISLLVSSSFTRFGRSPSGIRCPLRLRSESRLPQEVHRFRAANARAAVRDDLFTGVELVHAFRQIAERDQVSVEVEI